MLLTLDPATIGMLTSAAMLAPDGRCKTLDAAADGWVGGGAGSARACAARETAALLAAGCTGQSPKKEAHGCACSPPIPSSCSFVRGEACVTLGLSARPLDACGGGASGSTPQCATVVAGAAVNQDGRSSSLTAPNGPSQQAVIRLALADAGLAPGGVATLEMHGTGGGRFDGGGARLQPVPGLGKQLGFKSWRVFLDTHPSSPVPPTGTALGDPIEVGAALAVFGSPAPHEQPGAQRQIGPTLELSAAKSTLGHAEPAAGAVGILRALFRLHSGTATGVLHLTAVTPYIASSLEQLQQGGGALAVWMPRGPSAAGSPGGSSAWQGAAGISGFAFQGTNAHIVLGRCVHCFFCCCPCCPSAPMPCTGFGQTSSGATHSKPALPLCTCRPYGLPSPTDGSAPALVGSWERRRHWYAPAAQRLLLRHVPATGSNRFECSLAHVQHAYLWQHAVGGRSILPGAAMFEAAFAAAAALLQEDQQACLGLQAAAIAAPLLLQQPGSGGPVLRMSLAQAGGAVQLSSLSAAGTKGGRPTVHLTVVAAAACAPAAVAPAASPPKPLALQLHSQPCTGTAWRGEAVGSLCQQALLPQGDSYHCHPAAVDAATHFGAAFDLSAGAAARVPVSLGRYSAGAAATGKRQLVATAAACGLQPDGSRVSSFGVVSGRSSVLSLARLQSRPIGSRAAAAAPQLGVAAQRLASDCCTYETVWQAAAPQAEAGLVPSRPAPALLLEPSGGWAALPRLPSSLHPSAMASYTAVLRMLHTLRPAAEQRLVATTSTGGAQHGAPLACAGGRACLAAAGRAAVSGLLKVAALEESAWRVQLRLTDQLAAGSGSSSAVLPTADAHGAAAASAVGFLPRMQLAAEQPSSRTGSQISLQELSPGCHIISGGMGGLGELTASHLAQAAQHGGHLLLLGRTGRFSGATTSQQRLSSSSGSIALLQVDAATAADAAVVESRLHLCGTPAASFIHTAGVLADKLLPSQRPADARAVFAPKLAGLAAALPVLQRQPLQRLLLFSSISAALGNRGQANYAAANAALDGAAALLAPAGCSSASVQWGAWAGAGMAAQTPQLLARLGKQGGFRA